MEGQEDRLRNIADEFRGGRRKADGGSKCSLRWFRISERVVTRQFMIRLLARLLFPETDYSPFYVVGINPPADRSGADPNARELRFGEPA